MADGVENTQEAIEQQPIKQSSSPLKNLELGLGGILLGILFFVIVFLVLNYFNIIILSKAIPALSFLPHRPIIQQTPAITQPPTQPNNNSNIEIIEEKLSINCPVSKEFCSSGKITQYTGGPALTYTIASGSSVTNGTEVANENDIELFLNDLTKTKTLFVSKTIGGSCFIITYIFPNDVEIPTFQSFPLTTGQQLTTMTNSKLKTEEEPNLILQFRKYTISPEKSCAIKDNSYKDAYPPLPVESVQIL